MLVHGAAFGQPCRAHSARPPAFSRPGRGPVEWNDQAPAFAIPAPGRDRSSSARQARLGLPPPMLLIASSIFLAVGAHRRAPRATRSRSPFLFEPEQRPRTCGRRGSSRTIGFFGERNAHFPGVPSPPFRLAPDGG